MAVDRVLAERVREALNGRPFHEQRMFGGLAYLIGGHMACALMGSGGLLVRLGPQGAAEAIAAGEARTFRMRNKPMSGFVVVEEAAALDDEPLGEWVARGVAFAQTLPAKA